MATYLQRDNLSIYLTRSLLLPLGVKYMERFCRRCKKFKPLTNFKTDKRREDGRTLTCRKCYTENKTGRYKKLPEDYEARSKKMRGRKHSFEWRLAISRGNLAAKGHVSDPDHLRYRLEYRLWRERILQLKVRICEL